MDKEKLIAVLDEKIAKDRPEVEKLFLRLTKEVWQIDWTVAPYDIVTHMMEFDISYFYRFMGMDYGDEKEEQELIVNWLENRHKVWHTSIRNFIPLIEECNELRREACY